MLQQLGLKEYEAKCLVALTRIPQGTAKEISEISEVPRTRVYDAIRALETQGLVEVQHSNPQQFRSVSVEEAAETLRQEYESRTETLVETMSDIEPVEPGAEEDATHEVWALAGTEPIRTRTQELIEEATDEILLIVGHEKSITDDLIERLRVAHTSGIDVLIGTSNETLREFIQEQLPDATVFVSGLEWLDTSPVDPDDDAVISRLLLVDGRTILISSERGITIDETDSEKAVFGRGFDNGIVIIARRLMATGLGTAGSLPMADER
ncbi:putative transcriptional regulator [Haladaptatus paucihalophilus DX253]|uniref:Putative transcriptional regulator n=1 Tax=Haladaptatus paucihalophilus DX253 TaxID=797209 RepID=E7QXU9_HALPU|nr:putative transcriptional regulator [Haladaptatus paucihalophilus DX253]